MILNKFSLTGKVALVTGCKRGIGKAMALALAEAGADIIGVSASLEEGSEISTLVTKLGREFHAYQCDFSQRDDLYKFINKVKENHPVIDILVNNAGIIRRAQSLDFSEDDWDAVMDINLKVVFFLSQAFARSRIAANRGGSIINIASLLSFQGGINVPSYTASKSAVAGLTKTLSNEWSASGITVNAVAPGYVVTNNTEALRKDEARNQAILDRIPIGRWAAPEDICGAVTFLASPAARYVTGITLPVDGGWLGR